MYNKIKKQNGERFAKAIRAFDSGIFDIQNLDKIIKFAGSESEPIMNYLVSLKNIQIQNYGIYKNPIELLDKAGYDAFYANTLEKQNSIKHLFKEGEAICTFNDKTRHDKYHIIHCVKKNVANIKRSKTPEREDEYGTSVISIQILKTGGFISIKNRYNHTIPNPDNTFNSNPDNIIAGLSEALKTEYNVDFSSKKTNLPDGFIVINNQILKFNYEANNMYFGANFYAKDGKIHQTDSAKELMLDNFILNWQTKQLKNPLGEEDGFINAFNSEVKNKKLNILNTKNGEKSIFADNFEIIRIKNGNIIFLNFPSVTDINNYFLYRNVTLKEISLKNAKKIGNHFLCYNAKLHSAYLPTAKDISDYFLYYNQDLTSLHLPSAIYIKSYFMYFNNSLKKLHMPKAEVIGENFLYHNEQIETYIGNFDKIPHITRMIIKKNNNKKINIYNNYKGYERE